MAHTKGMSASTKIDVARLKRDIIESTGEGGQFSRRKLSLLATDGKNPDLVRDIISRGHDRAPSVASVVGLAQAMGKDSSDYIRTMAPAQGAHRIAVIGRVQAGAWSEHPEWPKADQYEIEVDPSPVDGAVRFGLEMVGHSMDKIIPPGSILECLSVGYSGGPIPRDGDIVVVRRVRNDLTETTCKRLEIRPDGEFILHCESHRPEFSEPVFMGRPDPDSFSDDGTAIIAIVDKATQRFFRRN